MFTAMIRPLVWLLALLALLGAGWLVYAPGRDALLRIAEIVDPPEAERAAASDDQLRQTAPEPPASTSPVTAGDTVAPSR